MFFLIALKFFFSLTYPLNVIYHIQLPLHQKAHRLDLSTFHHPGFPPQLVLLLRPCHRLP